MHEVLEMSIKDRLSEEEYQKIVEDYKLKELLAYQDELIQQQKRVQDAGISPALFLATKVVVETMWDRVAFQRLLDLLEKNKVLTREDRTELNASVDKTRTKFVKATMERYPEFAPKLDPKFFDEAEE
jgi:hypothetical protein